MRVGIDCRKIDDFGIGTYIRGLLNAMTGVDYVAFGPRGIELPAGVEHAVVDAPKYSIRELFTIGRGANIDLFHAPHYVVPFVDVPFVVTIHDLIHLRHRNPLARIYARRMIGRAIRKSRRVITVSETVRREIETEFGHAEKIALTPNGVDHVILSRADGEGSPRERSFASLRMTDRPYFLFVGNDKPHKNVDRLVEASSHVQGAQLILVGGVFERFRDRAFVTGFVSREELASLYRGAIALVQPSLDEGFGLPALEAMACGTAVITSNAPALIEITGDAALHVDAQSIDAIANAMSRVMHDASLRTSMIARGIDRAKKFTWGRCADLTREIYAVSLDNAFH
ncbi:MAG TPA: glycosyltransferase family 1 protein [Thermoanaerobaculia bacterium]|nr:glycosyltransferase family 1 protein [Thermoanaerobaculia bacterium]